LERLLLLEGGTVYDERPGEEKPFGETDHLPLVTEEIFILTPLFRS
jgi:hypothetical protein